MLWPLYTSKVMGKVWQTDGWTNGQTNGKTDKDLKQYIPDHLNWWYHVQISVIKVTGGNIMQSTCLLSKTKSTVKSKSIFITWQPQDKKRLSNTFWTRVPQAVQGCVAFTTDNSDLFFCHHLNRPQTLPSSCRIFNIMLLNEQLTTMLKKT